MLSITHDKGSTRSDGSDDLKIRQGKQQLLHIKKKCKNAENKNKTVCSKRKKTLSIWSLGNLCFRRRAASLRCTHPPALSPSTPAIWKISPVQFYVFFLSTNTIANSYKDQTHSDLSPAPRAQRGSPFPLCSLLLSCPYMTHKKETAIQISKVCKCLPHNTNHTISQIIWKFLISTQPQSSTAHK